MAGRGKPLEFTAEEVEDLADMGFGDRRVFALLALLFPFIDVKHHHFHIDHVFPKSRFTKSRLRNVGLEDEQVDVWADCCNRIANLQLLDGPVNIEKQAMLPAKWVKQHFSEPKERQHYCAMYLLGKLPKKMTGFAAFYGARRERLQRRIADLVNLA